MMCKDGVNKKPALKEPARRTCLSGKFEIYVACCVLGSNSLTRYLGMPPNGEIAIPIYKNIPQALGVNGFEISKRGFFRRNACAPAIPSMEKGAGLS
jgi:hypothetical protein